MLLTLYNLALCLNFYEQIPFLCPYLCVGRSIRGSEGVVEAVPGNPCEGVSERSDNVCTQTRNWVDTLYSFFQKLADPEDWKNLPKSAVSLGWIDKEAGYACKCSKGFEWVHTRMECVPRRIIKDRCDSADSGCDSKNTLYCITERSTGGHRCICKDGYTGTTCKSVIDACQMKILRYSYVDPVTAKRKVKITNGNEMCNVNMSGNQITGNESSLCIPVEGTNQYRCECKGTFVEDTRINLPNCMKIVGACDRKLCVHGTCVTAEHSRDVAICVCNPGYDGPSCTHKIDHWSVWSECLPVCGQNRTRKRRRLANLEEARSESSGYYSSPEVYQTSTYKEKTPNVREIIQVEVCPPRVKSQCPQVQASPEHKVFINHIGLLTLQSALNMSIFIMIILLGVAAFITRIVRGRF
uniref:EGF-like domain-containing protein n=1 Tax=Trichobilharzia regenti TaxID=157069 RepID=A0AA85KAQ6_TRIRE|nr:unnamed protein product [Trichobilharzia regenti]